jgi:hypothetical protein
MLSSLTLAIKFVLRLTVHRMETVASSVLKIIEAVERRKQIEEQMEKLVLQVTSTTREIEEMMRIGFRGRAEDIKKVQ